MRFIINFFIYGMLFYLIWRYFPDAFNTLAHWAEQVFNFIYGAVERMVQIFHRESSGQAQSALYYLLFAKNKIGSD